MPRPSKPLLSPEIIYRAALAQLDRTGKLNLPELAHDLGVSVSSLYHHVDGRNGVLEGVRGVLTDWDCGDPGDWAEMVRRWAQHYRDTFSRHPAAIPALMSQPVSDPNTMRQYDVLATALVEAGFSATSVVLSVSALDVLCLGAALDASAPSTVWSTPSTVSSALQDAVADAGLVADRSRTAFELQLDWAIGGMRDLLDDDRESARRGSRTTASAMENPH